MKTNREEIQLTVRGCLLHRRRTTSVTRVLIAVRSAPDRGEDESVEQNAEHDWEDDETLAVLHVSLSARLILQLKISCSFAREVEGSQSSWWEADDRDDAENARVLHHLGADVLALHSSVLALRCDGDYRSVRSIEHALWSVNAATWVPLYRCRSQMALTAERGAQRIVVIGNQARVDLQSKYVCKASASRDTL